MKQYVSGLLMLAGAGILVSVLAPIGLSQLHFSLNQPTALIDPTSLARATEPSTQVLASSNSSDVDYASPANWFDYQNNPVPAPVSSKISYYTLSIPRLGLTNAPVEINGTDLKKNSIQYPGTAVPGSYGNTVIFGHSTLPQLYKPNDGVSIFNPLVKAKVGDEVIVNYDGVTYRYIIKSTEIVKPTQIEVLAQRFDRYELTLITCTPLGTYINRFVARAELVN